MRILRVMGMQKDSRKVAAIDSLYNVLVQPELIYLYRK